MSSLSESNALQIPKFKIAGENSNINNVYIDEDGNHYAKVARQVMPPRFFQVFNQLADSFSECGGTSVVNWSKYIKKHGITDNSNEFLQFAEQQQNSEAVKKLNQLANQEFKDMNIQKEEQEEKEGQVPDEFNFLIDPSFQATVLFEGFTQFLEKKYHPEGKLISNS